MSAEDTAPVGAAEETGPVAAPGERTDLDAFFEPQFLGFRRAGDRLEFAIHARAERGVALELFELGAPEPAQVVELDPDPTAPDPWMLWTTELETFPATFEYLVRVDGGPPLLDPYARELSGGETWGRSDDLVAPGVGRRYRCRWTEALDGFDWEGVEPPGIDPARRVIYELHVRGFTRDPSSGVAQPGTYLGLVEKIPELQELGVTTVELLPVCEFDETENPRVNPETGERLLNYWGYSPVSWFAPKAAYASSSEPGAAARELRELVRELHRAGLEAVLDVVYNHTAEGSGVGTEPLRSWQGLDADAYYLTGEAGEALDVTGCGNTVRTNHPITRRLIVDSLRYWAEEMRVDGFRFDLGAVFYRGDGGELLESSPAVEQILADPLLAGRLLIAEPWDAHGFRPAAGFPRPWKEWDGSFRDTARRWTGGIEPDGRELARQLAGQSGLEPERAVRFVACHDGRPLADVVAYASKHNHANGEASRDGWDGEIAWNGGVEGPAESPALRTRREREIRLLWTLLAAAPGTLLLPAGDESLHTQRGNNNVWCQDNELAWIGWERGDEGERLRNFVRQLLSLRRSTLVEPSFTHVAYAEPYARESSPPPRAFLLVHGTADSEAAWVVAVNPDEETVRFPLPSAMQGRRWQLRLDSARSPGTEIFPVRDAPFLAYETTHLAVAGRAARILVAETLGG